MEICVIGTGYVGLVTGAVFADLGNEVICIDAIKEKVEMLKQGIMPIYEPGLEEMVKRNMDDGRLKFDTTLKEAVPHSKVIFICVGTPPKNDGQTDLSQVESAAKDIANYINEYKVIVNKSTVPVGTGEFVKNIIEKHKRKDVEFDVVSNPEFLREGSAINDSLYPDRIVIGAPSKNVAMILLELYAPLEKQMIITNVQSAEIIKYASNAFLATKISFINEIANLCEIAGADIEMVRKGVGADSRIGHPFLNAGLGYGGSCFPKDVSSLIATGKSMGVEFKLLQEVEAINRTRVTHFVETIEQGLGNVEGKTIGILGLAFKPNTDDMREAKSIDLIKMLKDKGANIQAYDPEAMKNAKKELPDIKYCENPYQVAENADALCLVTEWNEFRHLNMDKLKKLMKEPVIFDGRNLYNPENKRRKGFKYYSIGRPHVVPDEVG